MKINNYNVSRTISILIALFFIIVPQYMAYRHGFLFWKWETEGSGDCIWMEISMAIQAIIIIISIIAFLFSMICMSEGEIEFEFEIKLPEAIKNIFRRGVYLTPEEEKEFQEFLKNRRKF